jgi:hypothetical protein
VGELGGCEHTVSPDHIEIASFMALAGVTGGELRIEGCVAEDLRMIRMVFRRLGLDSEMLEDGTCHVPGGQELRIVDLRPAHAKGDIQPVPPIDTGRDRLVETAVLGFGLPVGGEGDLVEGGGG